MISFFKEMIQESIGINQFGVGPWEIRKIDNTLIGGILCTQTGSVFTELFIFKESHSIPMDDGIKIIKITAELESQEAFIAHMKCALVVSKCNSQSISYTITNTTDC